MFDQILDLVGQPPGSLVYHFIILFAIEFAVGISFGQWMRERDNKTARLTIAIVGIFAARTLVLIASLLAWQGVLPRNVLLPPIERTVDTLTVLALAWVFVTMDDPSILQRNFAPDLGAAVALGMMLAGFVGTYYYWYFSAASGQLFNGSWLDILWATFQIVFSAAGLIWMLIRGRYVYDPFLKGFMLILLGGAAGVHLVRPMLGDVASAMRVGQIVVMPMLAAVAYRHVVEQLLHWDEFEPTPASQPQMMVAQPIMPAPPPIKIVPPPESLDETHRVQAPPEEEEKSKTSSELPMLEVVEAIGGLLSSLEQSEVAREAARTIATALRADVAVLAIVDEGTQQAAILGAYDNIAQTYLPRAVLDLADHPSIVNTLGRLRQMRLTTNRNLRELRDLYEQLMITHEGPAYLQPLVNGEERIGVLIVGSPYSERQLSNEERNLLDRLGPLVTAAMLNAQDYHRIRMENEQVMVEEGARLATLSDDLTATTSELNDARRQMDEMKSYIRDLHRQVESFPQQQEAARLRIEALQQELERLETGGVKEIEAVSAITVEEVEEVEELSDVKETEEVKAVETAETVEAAERVDSSELEEAYEELRARLEELEPDAIAAQQLREENERLRLERALQQRLNTDKLGEMEQERQQLQHELNKLEKLQQENEDLREQLQATEKYSDEIEELKEEIGRHKAAIASRSHVELIRFEQRLDEAQQAAQTEIASLRTRLAQASISQQEVSFLQEQLGLKSREVITLQTRLTEVEAVASALNDQIKDGPASLKHLTALQERVAEQTSMIATLRSELEEAQLTASLDTETLQQQQALDESDREAMAHLEAQLAERAALVEALQAQLSEKTRAIVDLKAHMEEVETSMRSVESQLSHKTDEVTALQESLAETRTETQGRMEALRLEGSRDDSEMDQAYVENLEAQLAEKSAAIQTLEEQLNTARASMESLEDKLAATNQAVTEVISDARKVDSHDEVIASIAQELRTPMSSIMGYTELLLRESVGILGTLQRKFLQRVKANTERMGSLLDDLVQITALDTGQYQFEPEPVDALRAVEEAVMNQANQYREKGLTLRLALPQALPPVSADRDAFIQLMGHLLSNAALASPIESEVHLSVMAQREILEENGNPKDCLYITVEDSGGGVAEEDYERVFSRKYRADNPLIEGLGDTGVSLSLAKTLIDEHGGRIWLESESGIGTTFHVLLPFETAQDGA